MVKGIGTDIVEVQRIANIIEKYGERFLNRVFTPTENEYCSSFKEGAALHYAARFAAKEAFSKAIGTGITQGFKFNEIGIKNHESGEPTVELNGGLLEKWGKYRLHVSLSHTKEYATAVLIMEEVTL